MSAGIGALLVSCLAMVQMEAADIPGWQVGWPSPQKMLQGHDPAQVQQFLKWSDLLSKNPRDVNALDNRGYLTMVFASLPYVLAVARRQGSRGGGADQSKGLLRVAQLRRSQLQRG
jgi:hypothetical protein